MEIEGGDHYFSPRPLQIVRPFLANNKWYVSLFLLKIRAKFVVPAEAGTQDNKASSVAD
jgi:hypothetical protein